MRRRLVVLMLIGALAMPPFEAPAGANECLSRAARSAASSSNASVLALQVRL
jgi:hypothetical protein